MYSQSISYLNIILADLAIHVSEHDNLARITNDTFIVNDHEKTLVEHESNKRADSIPVHEKSKIVYHSNSRERDASTPIHEEMLVEHQSYSKPFESKYSEILIINLICYIFQ